MHSSRMRADRWLTLFRCISAGGACPLHAGRPPSRPPSMQDSPRHASSRQWLSPSMQIPLHADLPPCRPPTCRSPSMQTLPIHADQPSMQTPSKHIPSMQNLSPPCRSPSMQILLHTDSPLEGRPSCEQTNTCKNITFPILRMR